MRKLMTIWMMAFVLMVACMSNVSFAQGGTGLGGWSTGYYEDEFGDLTDKKFIVLSSKDGKFSNSAAASKAAKGSKTSSVLGSGFGSLSSLTRIESDISVPVIDESLKVWLRIDSESKRLVILERGTYRVEAHSFHILTVCKAKEYALGRVYQVKLARMRRWESWINVGLTEQFMEFVENEALVRFSCRFSRAITHQTATFRTYVFSFDFKGYKAALSQLGSANQGEQR